MREQILRFMQGAPEAKQQAFADNPYGAFVRNGIPAALYETGLVDREKYLIEGSAGKGNWALVPWICIFDKSITTSATRGVYIVYLLSKDSRQLYLTFNQGCTEISKSHGKRETIRIMREKADEIVGYTDARGFGVGDEINLGERLTSLGQYYERGTIYYKRYDLEAIPSEEELRQDLANMMAIYREYANHREDDGWWPTLEEYDPGITQERWLELLNDPEIIGPVWGDVMAMFYDYGGAATCTQLAQKYGGTAMSISGKCTAFAKAVYQKTNCPLLLRETGENRYWTILFQGKEATKSEAGTYKWRLRPELYQALTEFGILRYLKAKMKGDETEMKTSEKINQIKNYIGGKGFTYPDGLIENFYLSLKSKPFVILAGTSGTGKTRLVRLFAEAIGANDQNGQYKQVAVRPDWSDSTDLFGHVDLNGVFIPGAIVEFLAEAQRNPDHPYILCLDEMNLARVEYYLSDFLSVIETRDFKDGRITTDPLVRLEQYGTDGKAKKTYGEIFFPENLYVVGTVNMDETTFPFSRKVLDRANTIEFNYVDLVPDFSGQVEATRLSEKNAFLKTETLKLVDCADEEMDYIQEVCVQLEKINQILQKANAHVGYRVRDEICFYMLNNRKANLLPEDEALDNEIMQKILPRIQGSGVSVKEMLCELFVKILAKDYDRQEGDAAGMCKILTDASGISYPRSAEKVMFMVRRFEEDGFTSYWL